MIPRYTTSEMATLWSDAQRFRTWIDVELAACLAWEERGLIPAATTALMRTQADAIDLQKLIERAAEIEAVSQHDVIAFVTALEESLGDFGRFLHFGMTSSDLVDTAFALSLRRALRQILDRLEKLIDVLWRRADEHRYTVCLGRTHGQAAEPTSFGLKLLGHLAEFDRAAQRIKTVIGEISFGKLSGAVGNYGNIPPDVESRTLTLLELQIEPVATQIVPRDRHAMVFTCLAVVGGAIERLAVEIRHLMRSEVKEASEPFGKGQRGSSAMPHKKNPILSENLTGLSRLLRAYAMTALENQALWHERDISHSSAERVIAPDATTLLDFSLARLTRLVDGLVVDTERMRANLDAVGDSIYSGSILLELIQAGLSRDEAYRRVQALALRAAQQASPQASPQNTRQQAHALQEALRQDPDINTLIDVDAQSKLFDPLHHIKNADVIFARVRAQIDQRRRVL